MIANETIHHKKRREQMTEKLPTHTAFSAIKGHENDKCKTTQTRKQTASFKYNIINKK